MNEKKERFFSFPIGALALCPTHPQNTLQRIIDWALDYYGERTYAGWTAEALKDELTNRGIAKCGSRRPKGEREMRVALAASCLGVRIFSEPSAVLKGADSVRGYVEKQSLAARANLCQIKSERVWESIATIRGEATGATLTWREFRVLCALLSKIGASKFKECSALEIQARAAGCCGKRDFNKLSDAEQGRRKPLILSRSEIRTTLAKLEACGFFARYQHGTKGRESWFSFSLPRDELKREVLAKKSWKREKLSQHREQDASGPRPAVSAGWPTDRINRVSSSNATNLANINSKPQNDAETANPSPTTQPTISPTCSPTPSPTLTRTVFNKNSGNRNDLNEEQEVITTAPASLFSDEEKGRWPAFLENVGIDHPFPIEGCSTKHSEFRGWLDRVALSRRVE